MDRIKAIERAWIRDRALSGEILDDVVDIQLRFAPRFVVRPARATHTW